MFRENCRITGRCEGGIKFHSKTNFYCWVLMYLLVVILKVWRVETEWIQFLFIYRGVISEVNFSLHIKIKFLMVWFKYKWSLFWHKNLCDVAISLYFIINCDIFKSSAIQDDQILCGEVEYVCVSGQIFENYKRWAC